MPSGSGVLVDLTPLATDLSEPYRGGVPSDRLFDVERATSQLLDVIEGLTPEQHGCLLAWDGSPIPW